MVRSWTEHRGIDKSPLLEADESRLSFVRHTPLVSLDHHDVTVALTAPFPFMLLVLPYILGTLLFSFGLNGHGVVGLIGLGVLVISFITTLGVFVGRRRVRKAYHEALQASVAEIEEIQKNIANFVQHLDHRARRYFHCVTNTKVVNFFKLRQIEGKLTLLLSDLKWLEQRPTRANLYNAYSILNAGFNYQDGVELHSGNEHEISLADLGPTVSVMMHELERGVVQIENEVRHAQDDLKQALVESNLSAPDSLESER